MITLKQFMEVVDYRITEGSDFTWHCFGDTARPYTLSAWNGDHEGWSFNITFDTATQEVYIVESCDYKNQRAYRIINPDWVNSYKKYVDHSEYGDEAWDSVDFVDLETNEDWLEKARAIVAGEEYDTRISVPLEFSDEELFRYMKLAHERDMTFNQLVEEALKEAIRQAKEDPEGFRRRNEILYGKKEIEPHGY